MPNPYPPEACRPGGLPADEIHERSVTPEMVDEAIRDWAADEKSWGGRWEDGTPRVRGMGRGLINYPRSALPHRRMPNGRRVLALPECEPCELQFISAEFLAAHRAAEHGTAGDEG